MRTRFPSPNFTTKRMVNRKQRIDRIPDSMIRVTVKLKWKSHFKP